MWCAIRATAYTPTGVAIPIPSGEGQNIQHLNNPDILTLSQYLYLLVKVRTWKEIKANVERIVVV